MTNKERGLLYSEVWKILNDWPNKFYLLIQSYVDNPMSLRGRTGINKYFRDMHGRLHLQKENAGLYGVKEAFDNYVENMLSTKGGDSTVTRISLSGKASKFVAKSDAARLLGCRLPKLEGYIQQNERVPKKVDGRLVSRKSYVLAQKDYYNKNLTLAEAAEAFGVSQYQMCS